MHRPPAGLAGHHHVATHTLHDRVNTGPVCMSAVLTETGNAAINNTRIDRLDRLVVDAEPVLDVGLVIGTPNLLGPHSMGSSTRYQVG